MQIRVLGSSGGIAKGYRTTSFLINNNILIDAGTGVAQLDIEEMSAISHIFLTHSHFDHIAALPLLADTVFDKIPGPIQIYALPETIKALIEHVFNDVLWPDFTRIPNRNNPVFKLNEITATTTVELDGVSVESIGVNHIVPGVAYRLESAGKSFAFSGDTGENDNLWNILNGHEGLDLLFVESAFPNENCELSIRSGHYCPQTLAADLGKLRHQPRIYLSHPKPGEEGLILEQCRHAITSHTIEGLLTDDVFKL
ncbi:MAG: 3',5'-cyclic-nucleotide phosphodiesterase [Gammaproteobacteria bacterium]|nr:3',5'-cyclic-nucleotide phosphodiesterase [Gammaproteobacteria bacterium]